MALEPLICGEWDGGSVWLQWTEQKDAAYEVELRFRKTAGEPWGSWMAIIPRQGEKSHWAVISCWKEGQHAEARVRIKQAGDDAWEIAKEVTFTKCTALFEFSSTKYDQHFPKGTAFHCVVDLAACAYALVEDIEVKPGIPVSTKMEALGNSGYFQLDYPGHFELKPSLGLRVMNIAPSENDVTPTGREFTEMKPKAVHDVVTMAVGTPSRH